MKAISSLIVAMLMWCCSFAQITNETRGMSPKEYASWYTKFYAEVLSLDKSQQKHVYSILLHQQKKKRAIFSGKLIADKETLRSVYFAPDDALKDIFTQSQYMVYLSLQSHEIFLARSKAENK
jgi:hypothetical protein